MKLEESIYHNTNVCSLRKYSLNDGVTSSITYTSNFFSSPLLSIVTNQHFIIIIYYQN